MIAIFPGSFDLFHDGHLYILKKGCKKFSQIWIIVANNNKKTHLYSLEERKDHILKIIEKNNLKNVFVKICDEKYLAHYMKKHNIYNYIRGIRNIKDLLFEIKLFLCYKSKYKKTTLSLFKSNKKYIKISSTLENKKIDNK